jgi:hypothetical protein
MRLWCQECGRPSGPEAKGWRLYRTDDEDEPEDEVTGHADRPYSGAHIFRHFWSFLPEATNALHAAGRFIRQVLEDTRAATSQIG